MWSKNHSACIKCGMTKKPHMARGLCKHCYSWWWKNHPRNRAPLLKRRKELYWANREEELEKRAAYRAANRDKCRAWAEKYRKNNREKVRASGKAWRIANHEKELAIQRNRYARKKELKGCATSDQIEARIEYYGGLCYACGGPYEVIDHVIPVSRNGTGWPANLRPMCRSCNSSKNNKLLSEWEER